MKVNHKRWRQFINEKRPKGPICFNPIAEIADIIYANVRWTNEPSDQRLQIINLFNLGHGVPCNDSLYKKLQESLDICKDKNNSIGYRKIFGYMQKIENRTMNENEYNTLIKQPIDNLIS